MTELPNGWAETSIGDLGKWGSGGTPKSDNDSFYGGEIPWIRSGDLPDGPIIDHEVNITPEGLANSSAKWVPEDAVLIAMYGATIGKLGITTYPVTTNQAVAFCQPNEAISSKFLFLGLSNIKQDLIEMGQGGAQPNISQQILKAVPFPLPPIPEQKRIVARVDGLTARTARARTDLARIPTLIARYKQRLLALAFSGELTAGWRKQFAAKEWCSSTVAGVATIIFDGPFGSNLKSADYTESGVRVVRLENIGALRFIREKETFVSEEKFASLLRHELKPNDVLFASFISEDIRVCLLPDDLETAAINKADCFCIRVDPDKCSAQFLAYLLASPTTYEVLKEEVHGATRPRISLKHLRGFTFDLPSQEEQSEIVRRIESAFGWLDRMMKDHHAASILLPKLDAAVLAKAFRGELVSQDPNDEPASMLLERIQAERAAAPKKPRSQRSVAVSEVVEIQLPPVQVNVSVGPVTIRETRGGQAMTKSRHDDDVMGQPYLAGLIKKGSAGTAQDLFKASGLPVADFYKQLAWEIEHKHIRDDDEKLEAL